ncbi:hypothetical protein [Natronomonas sp.]|uniref:hypothetical protein n=1 Tax=Natronomonas sp. TaxID=2184060 RepID=UPI002FC35853
MAFEAGVKVSGSTELHDCGAIAVDSPTGPDSHVPAGDEPYQPDSRHGKVVNMTVKVKPTGDTAVRQKAMAK